MDLKARLQRVKSVFSLNGLEMLIFFVTAKCNSKCKTCFYWKNINNFPNLSLAKIKEVTSDLGGINSILFSGGEPFLRDDLPEIVRILIRNNQMKILTIPTNGLLTKKIIRETKMILEENPDLYVSISVSLDGQGKLHDKIRGVKNNFQISLVTLGELLKLKNNFNNLSVVINTVIFSKNYKQIEKLTNFVKKEINPDGHFFEIIRSIPQDHKLLRVSVEELKDIYETVTSTQLLYFKRNLNKQNLGTGLVGFLRRAIREEEFLGSLLYQYKTQFRNYAYGEKWTVPCQAGKLIKVLESNGKFKDCELRNKRDKECFCTHVCFINISSLFNWRTYFFEFPYLFLRYKLFRKII